uniref:Uncharacterized protein n=1 Tax=Rubinisphaera brasiliensis (strain ATCC 49424 / DSM 5305 / JCM 21570 / IAM 15109 / NBRC 103401 / IFAM 1448) TaxID=756272 RepID=F0SNK4_RUBBR|nr:hypothetical protein Plabr_0209 [Rubinisphaera brasiliensis DSM 5305]
MGEFITNISVLVIGLLVTVLLCTIAFSVAFFVLLVSCNLSLLVIESIQNQLTALGWL